MRPAWLSRGQKAANPGPAPPWTPAQRRGGYSWTAPPNPAGRWPQHPGRGQRTWRKNEADGGLSAPGPHGRRAGVQEGGRKAPWPEGTARSTRKRGALGTRSKKVSFPERKRKESTLQNKTLVLTPTSVSKGAPEAHCRQRRVGRGAQIRPHTAGNTRIQTREKQVNEP